MKAIIFVLLIIGTALTTIATEPQGIPPSNDLAHAYVTIPYSELRVLWEAGKARHESLKLEPEAPPFGYLVHRADYRLELGERSSRLEAVYEVESLDTKWHTIPLLGGGAHLEKAESGNCPVIWHDGYALLTNKAGKEQVSLHLAAPGTQAIGAMGTLKLSFASATVRRLTISGIGPGMEARVNGHRSSDVKDGVAQFQLPAEAGDIEVGLAVAKIEEPPKPIRPSQWHIQSEVLASYSESRLRFQDHLSAHDDGGSGVELSLALPENALKISVEGEDLGEWSEVRNDEGGKRVLHVQWKTPGILDRELMLTYAVPQSPLAEQWTMLAPGALEDKNVANLFAILVQEGMELKGKEVQAAVGSERLPRWMREQIAGSAFVTAEGGSQFTLKAHWLPTLAAAEAIVSEAKCDLQLVADGSMQTSVTYTIHHTSPLAWPVELPPKVELLSCLVDGKPVRPILRENGGLDLSLPSPVDGKGGTTAAIVYAGKADLLDPVSGRLAVEMPRTPFFIEHLEWTVAIPELFEITAFEGNVTASASVAAPQTQNAIALRKDFCRGEKPAVSLFYQRRNLNK